METEGLAQPALEQPIDSAPVTVQAIAAPRSENWLKIETWFNAQFCNTGMATELYNRALSAKEALHKIFL